ncbi:hypothetical protein BKA56DRAFT_2546 [Ilyonectria sp. MPI-CAGE-AT-0026]|nr:hypothetical protein BKA56DRAFT_2546 [Ilyonectria sp. MPI-CAGE-AT-0026]
MGLAQARESARHGFFSVLFLRWTRKAAAPLGDGFYLTDKSQSSPSVHCLLTYIVFLFPPGYCHRDQVTGGPLFLMDHYGNAVSFYPVFLSPPLMLFFYLVFCCRLVFYPRRRDKELCFYVLCFFPRNPKSKFPNSPTQSSSPTNFTRHVERKRNGDTVSVVVDPIQPLSGLCAKAMSSFVF